MGFEGLLVEACLLSATGPEAMATDGGEMAFGSGLAVDEPAQGVQANLDGLRFLGDDQCVRQFGVVVSGDVLEPKPIRGGMGVKQIEEVTYKQLAHLRDGSVTGECTAVFMNGD